MNKTDILKEHVSFDNTYTSHALYITILGVVDRDGLNQNALRILGGDQFPQSKLVNQAIQITNKVNK